MIHRRTAVALLVSPPLLTGRGGGAEATERRGPATRPAPPATPAQEARTTGFVPPGTGFEGEPLAGSFDHVIAIDCNREPGTSPLNRTRPLGPRRCGGAWPHVDHDGPTHACVGMAKSPMKELPRTLDPDRHPVVAMGHTDRLAREAA